MAVLPIVPGHVTLMDWARKFGPDGKLLPIANLLSQSNEIVQVMPFMEGNLPTGHKASVQTGLPLPILRRFYQGVPPSKGGVNTIEDVCANQQSRNEVDQKLAELNGDVGAFRLSEALPHFEANTQLFAQQMMYGDTSVNKDGILGLTPRYNAIGARNGVVPASSANIIDSGGTGNNNTSVWLVVWGSNTVTGIFPKGSKAGLDHQDLGLIDAFDANNARYRAYAELWDWVYGLHVKDWRFAVRIANINVNDLAGRTGTQANGVVSSLLYTMIDAMAHIPSMGMGSATFLASRLVKSRLSQMALDKSQNALGFNGSLDQFGKVGPGSVAGSGKDIQGGMLTFQGVPVLTVDALSNAEARVI
jgi:hypothetical protein